MTDRIYTALFPFCGIGAGALGFLDAQVTLFGRAARFRSLGGIDLDPLACVDFEYLTKSPALCADVAKLTPAELRAFAGDDAPDVAFASPPCKGFSSLLSKKASTSPKYQELNDLLLAWVRLMLSTWATPPRLFLLENVPRIASRGASLLRKVKALLRPAGYVFHAETHDCGELGGLAQHRSRFLLVARHQKSTAPLLYKPIKKRVRACGEVLERLPLPGGSEAGPMHELPKLSWLNWVRLALIPAGGDWRDLPGTLEEGQPRREVFKRHQVGRWDAPVSTIAGSGSNGVGAVADPRVQSPPTDTAPTSAWAVKRAYDHGYGVLRFDEASSTIAGGSHPGQGAYSVADPRLGCTPRAGVYGVLRYDEAAKTITGSARVDNGSFAVADPRKSPPSPVVIVAADGTWHRPLTTLELAALQGLPTEVDGRPLVLAGKSTKAWRERVGNCVPPPAARAIAESMLVCLASADAGTFALSSGAAVWVDRASVANEGSAR